LYSRETNELLRRMRTLDKLGGRLGLDGGKEEDRRDEGAPDPVTGLAVTCLPPPVSMTGEPIPADLRRKPQPGTVSEVTKENVLIEFTDKRNLGRQLVTMEHFMEYARKR